MENALPGLRRREADAIFSHKCAFVRSCIVFADIWVGMTASQGLIQAIIRTQRSSLIVHSCRLQFRNRLHGDDTSFWERNEARFIVQLL